MTTPSKESLSPASFLDAFLKEVVQRKPKNPGDPGLLCLVPSALFAEECAHRLLDRSGSCASLAFHTPSSLARTIAEERGTPMLGSVGRGAVQAWVSQEVEALCGGRLKSIPPFLEEDLAYLRRFPKARGALAQALLLVRLHGCFREEDLPDSRGGRLLALFLEGFGKALKKARLADPARRLGDGLALLPNWLVDKGWVSLIALPAAPQSPEFLAYAAALQRAGAVVVEEGGAEELGRGPRAALPERLPELKFFAAQGEEGETEEALERIRVLLEEGARPDRIALCFVGGEPYLRLIEERAGRVGLPLRPTKGVAFRLTARGRAGRNWLRFVLLDAPAELRGRVLLEPLLERTGSPAAAALDWKARDQGWLGGLEQLRDLLREFKEEPEGFLALEAWLTETIALREELLSNRNTKKRCRLLREAMEREGILAVEGKDPFADLLEALPQVQDLMPAEKEAFALEELAQLFEDLIEEHSLPLPHTAKEGVRVLPLQRMGVLDFDHVLVLGCLRGRWPAKNRPNPWLSSRDLEHVGQKFLERFGVLSTLVPLPPTPCPPTREEELERRKFLLLLRGCRTSLCLSYPGVDLRAKPKSPSPWLEELRALKGDTHPLRPLSAALEERLGRMVPERVGYSELEAMTIAGFARRDEALRHFGGRFACLPPHGGDFVAARDRFHPGEAPSPFDALGLGPSLPLEHPISVTAFEDLGSCPLRFFFRHVLSLRPLPDEPSLDLISALDRGSAVHRILHKVFEALISQGLLDENPLPLEACLDLGVQEISRLLRAEADRLMSRQFLRFPRLRQEVLALWGKSLEAQFRLDLSELAESGARPVDLEKKLQASLVFRRLMDEEDIAEGRKPETRPLLLKGKYDRLDQFPNGRFRILDYKTGASAKKLDRKDILQGRKTQLYLYQRLFLEDRGHPEPSGLHPLAALRGVGPKFPIHETSPLPEAKLDQDFWEEPLKGRLEDSLATLVHLCDEGNFPFEAEHGPCRHCEFAAACPRHHAPTQDRMAREPRTVRFRALQQKSPPRKPTTRKKK